MPTGIRDNCHCGLRCVCFKLSIHMINDMRTNIVIDDELMKEVLEKTGIKTKREAVEEGLKLLLKMKSQEKILELRGKIHWEGDLDEMRRD